MSIKFGTSGWRGILADEFTFPRLRIAVQAIADYLREEKLHNRHVVIGYDTRFLSEEFAKTAAGVLAANGMESLLCNRDTPTPVVAFEVLHVKAAAGLNITASHNPPWDCGYKVRSETGAAIAPDALKEIEYRNGTLWVTLRDGIDGHALARQAATRSLQMKNESGAKWRLQPAS